MNWIDEALVSPIRIMDLTRLFDTLVGRLAQAQSFNSKDADVYSSLWLTCELLQQAKDLLTNEQLKSIRETKEKCLLILEVFELYTDTPLDMLSSESLVVDSLEKEHAMISWKWEHTINLDKSVLAQEEDMLLEMANTPIPEKVSQSVETQWQILQTRVRSEWGESVYQKALETSKE